MVHHTKFKADIAVTKVIADLVVKGHVPCLPISEHQPYDLVVVLKDGSVVKLQVKYASLKKSGGIEVKFRTGWVDKHGFHSRRYQNNDFDFYAVFCPEKEKVVYVLNKPGSPKMIRFERAKNHQVKHVSWADNYLEIKRESSETIRRTSETTKT
jgi:hypothetical protein